MVLAHQGGVEQAGSPRGHFLWEPVGFEEASDETVPLGIDPRDHLRGERVMRCPSTNGSVTWAPMTKDDLHQRPETLGGRPAARFGTRDDILGGDPFPREQEGIEKRPSVSKMPVEAAFRHAERAGQWLHSDCLHPLLGDRLKRRIDPLGSGQALGHDRPYGAVLTLANPRSTIRQRMFATTGGAMHIKNTHVRSIPRSPHEVFADLERMGTDGDTIWPSSSITFERTPGPLRVGKTNERHGIIRAVLDEVTPDRRLRWRAEQSFIRGTHGFEVIETSTGSDVAHTLDAKLAWWFVPVWIFKVRGVHDRILEALLDRLESPVDHRPTLA